MTLRRKMIRNLWIMMFLLLAVCTFAGKQDVSAATKKYVIASALNIRKKPSMEAEIVGKFAKGKQITIYGTEGEWSKVKYNDKYRYVASEYLSDKKPLITYTRYVKASALNIRAKMSTESQSVGKYGYATEVTVYAFKDNWAKVKFKGEYRYVCSDYLTKTKPADSASSIRAQVADYSLQFLGNPYKWGGASLTRGADCSGFTMAVYAHFGYGLPHSSVGQRSSGRSISWENKRAGDLICYNSRGGSSHVGIYIGGGQVVHASNEEYGIRISSADYRSVNCVRRIVE